MERSPSLPDRPAPWWHDLPGLVLVASATGEQVYASPALDALMGATGRGRDSLSALTPESRQALHERLVRKSDFQLDLHWAPNGQGHAGARSFGCSATWMPDPGLHLCIWVDITAPLQACSGACVESQFLQTLCNAIPVMVSYYSYPLRCAYANSHYARQYGHDEESIVGLTIEQVLGRSNFEAQPFREQAFQQRKAITYERFFVREDSHAQWFLVTLVPLEDAQGSIVGAVVMNQDITQRRLAEQALRESEDRLAKFMEASAEGVIFHRDGLITDVNPAACRLLGEPAGHLLGKETLQLLAPEHRPHARRVITQHSDTAYEGELLTHDGERIPVEVIGRSMLRNGEHLRMAVVRDISDRREAQLRIRELIAGLRTEKDRAEAADRAKSVFLAAASHDLRQPIHALSLFLTALRSMAQAPSVSPGELAEICRRMQASLDGLGQLLNMLLDVSRLDANAVEIARSPTSLAQLFTELDQDFHPLAREKGLRLRVLGSSLWVDTDPTVLRRILANLLSNAVRYTQRGRVLLGCRRRGTDVEIQVWDQGIGIPAEQRDAVFEEFYQIGQAAALRHESHGLGLGLSIVKRSAQLLDAPLDLRSQPGRGSMFCIRVPVCAPPEPCAPKASEASFARAAHGMGVLVIDDDAQVLSAMHSVLSAWGHRVFCALSPDEAVLLAITHTDKINLLISDYRLGGNVTALDAIHAVQACLPRPVPTYILTGDTSPQRIHEASILGFPLLHKPVQASALRNILELEAAAASALA
jgi:two-component system, sensor histidine kinase